jgi:hypothetical protein
VSEERKVTQSLGVWVVLLAGALAIPVGLVGYRWLERANLARTGFTETIRVTGARIDRACSERALAARFGRRYVRPYDDALLVQIPASQYDNRPERIHVVVRGTTATDAAAGATFVLETAYYRERALASQYAEVIRGAMSELADVVVRGCAETAGTTAASPSWAARCEGGPGFVGVCPMLQTGLTLPSRASLPVQRD